MGFELSPEYKDVPARIADFKAKHPDGSFQPVNPAEPYRIEAIEGRFFIVYTAAAYRSPDDKLPGIGVAWEPFPGRTPYTKDSELQNAETSAWGRAIIAALASESKHIASAEDVRNRRADAEAPPTASKAKVDQIMATLATFDEDTIDKLKGWVEAKKMPEHPRHLTEEQADEVIAHMATLAPLDEQAEDVAAAQEPFG